MHELFTRQGSQLDRTYYLDADGNLVAKIHEEDVTSLLDHNQQAAHEFRPHHKGELRHVAEIPVSLFYKWLIEADMPGYCTEEALEDLTMRKLQDPSYKFLLTVPPDYRIKRNV